MAFSFFKKKKNKGNKGDQDGKNSHYYQLKIKEIVQETEDAISIVFEMPVPAIHYQAGQFLTLIETIEGKEVRRSYSFCSAPGIDQDIAVTIKRVEGGLMSNYLADHAKSGDEMKIMEPLGRFTLEYNPDNQRHLVMFAGGSGITPMMSILKMVLEKETESKVSLIYANRNSSSIIFNALLSELEQQHSESLKVIHILDEADDNWSGYTGFLDEGMLTKIMEQLPHFDKSDTTYLLCGPEGMMVNAQTLLQRQGIAEEQIMKESFTSSHKNEHHDPVASSNKKVKIHYEGNAYTIDVAPGNSILETALDDNIDLPFSCQSGLCTACRGKLISGEVKMDEEEGLTAEEREQGYVLTCVGHPVTDDVEIEIG